MENRKTWDRDYFNTLNDEEKEVYLYNLIVYGTAMENSKYIKEVN